ncbi:MAG: C4-dicarboxylate ABC transporter substrate-binding protein, partial [Rhodobacteraceae bacterium]|nr:C4-dicarboxylate ABC transporter substrate-binding protein [Paracoccaceae bacterium]
MITGRRGFLGLALTAALVGALAGSVAASETRRVLPLATGDVTGAYFPAGIALCRVVN